MANTVVDILSTHDLVPWVEEGALKFAMRNFSMGSRVLTFNDMKGFNVRKVSLYEKVRGAQPLQEATDIPLTKAVRARLAEISPSEWGDRYTVTDRRIDTDPENILADIIEFLGYSLGLKREQNLVNAALSGFTGGTLGSSSTAYSVDLPIDAQFEFTHHAKRGQLYHVIHPFQARDVLKDLITYSGTAASAALDYRNEAIRGWRVPGFDGLNISVSDVLPRKIVHKLNITAEAGDTFRLEIGTGKVQGVNITADIAINATEATMITNIQNALNGLTGQSGWVASGTDLVDMTITAPIYLDAESELRIATNPDTGETYNDFTSGDVVITERSASARSLLFMRDALVLDIRESIQGHQDVLNHGRTLELAAYEKYGAGVWRADYGMFIESDASSALAVGT